MPTAWFVDGAYALEAWDKLRTNHKMDYIKLRSELERNAGEQISDAYFFNSAKEEDNQPRDNFHKILERAYPYGAGMKVRLYWLSRKPLYWPERMGGSPVLHPNTQEQYILTTQKAVDVALASYLIRSFIELSWDKLYLFAGDGDFYEPLHYLVKDRNVDLKIIGSGRSINEKLEGLASRIFELDMIKSQIMLA